MKKQIFKILLLTISIHSFGQNFPEELADSLQGIIDNAITQYNLKGATAAVRLQDDRSWVGVSGYGAEGIPIDTIGKFRIGSLTKMFTATVVLQLYEEGKLNLGDSLGKFIGPYEYVDGSIPIRKLLNHSTGFTDFKSHPEFLTDMLADPDSIYNSEDILSTYLEAPVNNENNAFFYSNTNFILLGLIIESITGNSVKEEIQSRLLDPLELSDTYLANDGIEPSELTGTWADFGLGLEYIGNYSSNALLSAYGSAAGMVSKPTELCKWIKALYEGMFLNQGTLDSMLTLLPGSSATNFLGYGLGTMSISIDGSVLYGHKGSMYTHSIVYYSIDDEISVSLIINHSDNESLDATFYSLFREVVSYLERDVTGANDIPVTEQELKLDIFPNPFTSHANISFALSEPGDVTILIYNSAGSMVSQLLESGLDRGEHKIVWQPQNMAGGIYLVKIIAINGTEANTMLYLK